MRLTPALAGPLSLAHPSTDPATLVTRVRAALGWEGSDFVVGLQGYEELMATLEAALDLEGILRIGDEASPPVRLLRALNASATGLRVTRVACLAAPWRWTRVGDGPSEITGVALRQQTYSDVVGALGRAGVTFRVLPNDTSTDELLAVARPLGSAVVDVDEVADHDLVVRGFLDDAVRLTYGLVSRETPVAVECVWLSMAAEREAAGTLMVALQQFSDLGTNLDFLHSDPLGPDRHDFYVGFHSDDARVVELQARLTDVGFHSRVLASFARSNP